jgi:regulator of RNase E activity RraA
MLVTGVVAAGASVSATTPKAHLSHADLFAVARLDTPTVADAIDAFDVCPRKEGLMRPEIRSVVPDYSSIAGYAVTCKIRAEEPRLKSGNYVQRFHRWELIVSNPPPRIAVIEDLNDPPAAGSFRGAVNGSNHQALGCLAVGTNRGVRNLREFREIGFRYFAQHVLVSHAYVHQVEFGKPVQVGGVTVAPDDGGHGDKHGVHTGPLEIGPKNPEAAAQIFQGEHRLIDSSQSPEFSCKGLKKLVGG